VTWGKDPHCDRQAASAVKAAQRLTAFQIWAWSSTDEAWFGPVPPRGFRLNVGPVLHSKTVAVGAHRSQLGPVIEDDPSGFRLDAVMLARARRPYEIYLSV
jgi:hypothetical protein